MSITETDQTIGIYEYIKKDLECVNEYLDPKDELSLAEKLNLAIQARSLRNQDEMINEIMDIKELIEESK
jgi:hypothetical protein